MTTAACIFDLDGTLADTSPVWRRAEEALFAYVGHPWSAGIREQFMGMNAPDVAAVVHRVLQSDRPLDACKRVIRDELVRSYEDGDMTEIPGAADLVRRLHGRVPLAVASGSPLRGIEIAVERIGVADCFDMLVTSEDVARGKPEPDVFLETARRLGVAPETCMVFEDSPAGARAALAAGMTCVVRPSVRPDEIAALPVRVVAGWEDVEEMNPPGFR